MPNGSGVVGSGCVESATEHQEYYASGANSKSHLSGSASGSGQWCIRYSILNMTLYWKNSILKKSILSI